MAQYKKMLACLQNQTEVLGVHGIGPDTWSGKTRNVTCDRCQDSYRALNHIYADVLGDIDADHICMDIVDAMNMTRMVWSQNLKCTQRNVTAEAPFIVVTCMCILPPLFYLLAWCLPQHQRGPIIRRLATLSDKALWNALNAKPNTTTRALATTLGVTHMAIGNHLNDLGYWKVYST
ncbi:unnamed protein product [Darwinula stevensoni]|uniref:Uncharacterized protein n=1 Tax=Darwinula stevensoni TaxID=69355 RepID=A0A7R9FTQ7_9CRUS|nr:unnamed protein product [Darwinula stevensoni]CAG0906640.1 unnamed protein product [Darwinula stevensoni]